MNKPSVFFPVFCIVAGGLWFLRAMNLIPATSTIFAIAFIIIGVAVFLLEGINKSSIVAAPIFAYTGVAIYLTSQLHFKASALIGLGMFLFGFLLLLARMDAIPEKRNRVSHR